MKPASTKSKTATRSETTRNVPAVRRSTAVSTDVDYGVAAGAGLENAGREDFAIPFLQILQKLSPQLDRKHQNYIKGAVEGMLYNTATGETVPGDEGVLVIPCFYRRAFVAWVLREKGGGFKGEYMADDPIVRTTRRDDRGREIIPGSDIQLVDTRIFGVLVVGEGGQPSPAIVTMSSTQLKKAKKWCTQMSQLQQEEGRTTGTQYPTFAHAYRLTTTGESNDKGNWEGWVITHEGLLHEAIPGDAGKQAFDAALGFYNSLKTGAVKLRADAPVDDIGHAPGDDLDERM